MVDEPEEPDEGPAKPSASTEDNGIVRAVLEGDGDSDPPSSGIELGELVRGTAFGHYVILSQLSGGDGDSVYAAFDIRTDRKVALKVVEVDGVDDEEAKSRREGMIAAATRSGNLEHPAIVAVRDAGTVGEAVYVAMEFIDGIDLRQWMEARDDPFPWPEVLRVFREAGAGLAAAHAAGCVHGDFTPSRVFMEKSGRICVFDFGLATPVAEVSSPRLTVEALEEQLSVDVTHGDDADEKRRREGSADGPPAALLGTPHYLAPELHAGIEPDAKADQFAFCAAMYEALYGEVPFKGDTADTIASEALGHHVRPAPPGSDVPTWLRKVLLQGLSPRRRDRYPSMEVLLRHLEHDPPARRLRWVAGLGVLALVAATAAGITLLLDREASRCEADAELLSGSWDTSTRDALEAGFLSARPPATDTWEHVQADMDDWAAQWLEYHSLACKVRQADDDDGLFERRNTCLQGVLEPFSAFSSGSTDMLAAPRTREGAVRVIAGIWRPADCRSEDVLDYAIPSEHPAKLEVDRAWLQLLAGDFEGARDTAQGAVASMPPEEHTPASVRARLLSGLAAAHLGAPDAPALLHEAAAAAAAASLRVPQAEAWIALSQYANVPERPFALSHAQLLVDALKNDRLRAQLLVARGAYQHAVGRDQDALASYHRALALLQTSDTRTTIMRSDILFELGELANSREEWATASQYLDEVISIREATFGLEHRELVGPLLALGRALVGAKQAERAARTYDRGLSLAERSEAPPRITAALLVEMGTLEVSRAEPALAAKHYAEAVETLEGTTHDSMLAEALLGLGLSQLEAGVPAKATGPLERASVLASRVGWPASRRATVYDALGRSLLDADPDAALDAFRTALEGASAEDIERLEGLIASLQDEASEAAAE